MRYELERVASQLKMLDNQVSYSTVYLYVTEVQEYTPVAEKTTWERIRDGFTSSLKDLGEGIRETFIWVLVNSPYLVIVGALGTGAVIVLKKRKVRKAAGKHKNKPSVQPETKEE